MVEVSDLIDVSTRSFVTLEGQEYIQSYNSPLYTEIKDVLIWENLRGYRNVNFKQCQSIKLLRLIFCL